MNYCCVPALRLLIIMNEYTLLIVEDCTKKILWPGVILSRWNYTWRKSWFLWITDISSIDIDSHRIRAELDHLYLICRWLKGSLVLLTGKPLNISVENKFLMWWMIWTIVHAYCLFPLVLRCSHIIQMFWCELPISRTKWVKMWLLLVCTLSHTWKSTYKHSITIIFFGVIKI